MKLCRCPTCPHAGELQGEWCFYRSSKAPDGLQWRCKTCMNAARDASRHAKPERERQYNARAYRNRMADPERAAIIREQSRESKRRVLGITPDRYRVGLPEPEGMVDVAPIREAVQRSGLSNSEVAGRMGVDEAAVRRGLQRESMAMEKALRILDAIGTLPVEIGL